MGRKTLLAGSAAVAAGISIALRRPVRKIHLRDKVVLITGGSHGLGLALAREFADRGSRLALCARHPEELEMARRDLAPYGVPVLTVTCDVSDRDQVERMIASVYDRFGQIDVLVNNAGVIQVGPIENMTLNDFELPMDVMFWGTVHTTLAALPHMRQRGQGRIVNITSIGGKVSVPHLVPYSCAKFAATAFSEGLRSELNGTGIKVVTIAPGLMRTGSYLNAIFKNNKESEVAWFSASASLPVISMSADRAARSIVSAAENGTAERILSAPANLLALFHGVFPGLAADTLGLINRILPRADCAVKPDAAREALRTPWLRALTTLGRKAAERYLQPAASRR